MPIIALLKSHYSIGKSILTLEKPSEIKDDYPVSICDIAIKHKLDKVHLIDDSFSGFLEIYNNLPKSIQLIFGIRFTFTADMDVKDDASCDTEHKVVLIAKNRAGYHELIKIYSEAATRGFYYVPRLDFKTLKTFDLSGIQICVPFYDSYIYINTLKDISIIPDGLLLNKDTIYFKENNGLPFDPIIAQKLEGFNTMDTKSIYYYKKCDFEAYLTRRCIDKRTTLDKPNLEHMTSNEFCFESYLESIGEKI